MNECKYCGTKYDPIKRDVCPNCGGSTVVSEAELNQAAEQEQYEKTTYTDNSRKLRNLIFVGAGTIVAVILIVVIATSVANNKTYTYTNAQGQQSEISQREIKTAIDLGINYFEHGDYAAAIREFKKVPVDYSGYNSVQSKLNEAEEEYANVLLEKAESYLSKGDYSGALALFESEATLFNNNTRLASKKNETLGKYKDDFLTRASEYLAEKKYTEALSALTVAQTIFPNDSDISAKIVEVNKAKILEKIAEYEQSGDYASAITYLDNELLTVNNDTAITEKLTVFKNLYKDSIISDAKKAFDANGYEGAINVLNNGLIILPQENTFISLIAEYNEYAPVWLWSRDYYTSDRSEPDIVSEMEDNYKGIQNNVSIDNITSDGWGVAKGYSYYTATRDFYLNSEYKRLSGTIFISYAGRGGVGDGWWAPSIKITCDDKVVYEKQLVVGDHPVYFEVDLTGVQILYVAFNDSGGGISNFNLYKK